MLNRIVYALIGIVACATVMAQVVADPVTLAKTHNPSLKSQLARLRSQELAARAAYSLFLPQISGSLAYTYVDTALTPGNDGYQAGLQASHNVFRGGSDLASLHQAKLRQRLEAARLEVDLVNLYAEILSAYADRSFAENALTLFTSIIQRRKGNQALVALQYQGGRENKASVALAEAYLANAEYSLFQAQNILEVNHAVLARVIGLPPQELPPKIDAPHVPPPINPQDIPWQDEHPLIRIANLQITLAQREVTRVRGNFLPTLDLSAGLGFVGPSFFPDQERWNTSVSLSMPFFTGGRNRYTYQQSQSDLLATRFSRANIVNEVRETIAAAWRDFREAQLKLEVDQKFESAAKMRAEIARIRYNNGLVSFDNWDIIENDLIARQTARIQSERNLLLRQAALTRALGRHGF